MRSRTRLRESERAQLSAHANVGYARPTRSRSAGMADDRHPPSEYRWARQVSAVLLIAVVVLVVVLDVVVEGYEVSPPVLVPLLLTAAGLLSVDLPKVRP